MAQTPIVVPIKNAIRNIFFPPFFCVVQAIWEAASPQIGKKGQFPAPSAASYEAFPFTTLRVTPPAVADPV